MQPPPPPKNMNTLNVQQNSITNNMVPSTNMIPVNNQALNLFSNMGNNYDRTEMIYLNNASDPSNSDMWMDPNFCNSIVAKNNSMNSFPNSNLDLLGLLSSGMEINSNSDNFVDYPLTSASIINPKNGLTMSKSNFTLAINNDQSMPSSLVQNVNRPVINQIILDRNITLQDHENNTMPAMNNITHLSPTNLLHENNINNANDLPFPDNLINSTTDLSGLECLNVLGNSGCDRDVPESGHWDNISLIAQSGIPSVPEMISQVDNLQSSPFTSQNSSLEDLPDAIFAQMVDELVTYKCKFCSSIYVTFSRDEMVSHLKTIHDKEFMISLKQTSMPVISQSTPLPPWNTVTNCNTNFMSKESNQNIQSNHSNSGNPNVSQPTEDYSCNKCPKVFCVINELEKHSLQCHAIPNTQVSNPVSKSQNVLHKPNSQPPVNPPPNSTINAIPPNSRKPINNKLLTIATSKVVINTPLPPIAPKNGSIAKQPTQPISVKRKRPMTPLKKSSRDRQNAQQGCYICEFKGCNVRFRSIENLEYHRKCHTNGKITTANKSSNTSFACPECNFECLTWNSMSGHVWRRHFIDLELHACDQCSFRTYSLSKLENLHKRTHSAKRPYVCPKCNMNFKTYKLLWGHKKKCMDIPSTKPKRKPVNCGICNSQFAREYLLTIHLETVHYKVRPYLCQVCGYSANRPTTLKMHMRQHSGEKPFACDLCTFRTADHNTLRRHNMTHSGEYKYKCLYCPYTCIQSTTYRSHLRKKHPREKDGLMFTCKLCNFQTVNEQLLNVHTASHKPEENNSSSSSGTTALNSQTESQSSHTNQSHDSLADNQIISLVQAVQFSIHDREIT